MLIAYGDNVIILPADNKKIGNVLIPQSSVKRAGAGQVFAVEDNKGLVDGEEVLYEDYAGFEIEYEGERYIICPIEDIIAKHN